MAKRRRLKIPELKAALDVYSKDIKAVIAIKPQQFDTTTVATMITKLPVRKWGAAQAVIEATMKKKDLDNQLKVKRAAKMLVASQRKDALKLSNAEDRKAFVESQEDVQNLEVDCINAEAELLGAKMAFDCLDDLFTAGKKIMDFLVEQDRATKEYSRYANEGRKHQ